MRVDVAIQSYKKPESLIYTCLTLKEFCGKHIDKIFINDDLSQDGSLDYYLNKDFIEMMNPIEIHVRENTSRAGLYFFEKRMLKRRPHNLIWYLYYKMKGRRPAIVDENDVRYQWAIDQTNNPYIYITHDDVEFRGDVIGEYLNAVKDTDAIIGELGQCWRCPQKGNCNPKRVIEGKLPSFIWPLTSLTNLKHKRDCRINEWSCLINVDVARRIARDKAIFFGAFEDMGDTGAYWFDYIVKEGMGFGDPLIDKDKNLYYKHCWQGFAGFQTDIYGDGANKYDARMIKEKIAECYKIII